MPQWGLEGHMHHTKMGLPILVPSGSFLADENRDDCGTKRPKLNLLWSGLSFWPLSLLC